MCLILLYVTILNDVKHSIVLYSVIISHIICNIVKCSYIFSQTNNKCLPLLFAVDLDKEGLGWSLLEHLLQGAAGGLRQGPPCPLRVSNLPQCTWGRGCARWSSVRCCCWCCSRKNRILVKHT